ncbi:GntR family transcriptional regulator [Rhodobacter sp. NTK016B]|uniref:GntR family transcriptional regulator n=1 Tax=Rhodobacter sp. NTK016B TaxID=2759676 RepID=UPI001A8C7474|nr:GntR family transcriptional regulator [Rhodobacter sp. NTK016B]MBN8294373.1 GntR family transcriptional regulator [Rhodobacter sp. NTK016B]
MAKQADDPVPSSATTASTTQRIRQALENAILNGEHRPGARLDPEALARQFACSRTPIRDVLQQLEASGLVQVQPKRGTFVTEWSFEELAERFEMMAEVEASCARLAARRITEAELSAFAAAHDACREAARSGDAEAYYQANTDFHCCLYAATHNSFLRQEALRLHRMLQPYRRLQLRGRNRIANSLAEHEAILGAVRRGDAEGAGQATYAHILVQGDRFHDLIAAVRSASADA